MNEHTAHAFEAVARKLDIRSLLCLRYTCRLQHERRCTQTWDGDVDERLRSYYSRIKLRTYAENDDSTATITMAEALDRLPVGEWLHCTPFFGPGVGCPIDHTIGVSGGSLLDAMAGVSSIRKKMDVDVFLPHVESISGEAYVSDACLNNLFTRLDQGYSVAPSPRTATGNSGRTPANKGDTMLVRQTGHGSATPLQIIQTVKTLHETINDFDISVCANFWTPGIRGGKLVILHPLQLAKREMNVVFKACFRDYKDSDHGPPEHVIYPLHFEKTCSRVRKYEKRGFKVAACAIKENDSEFYKMRQLEHIKQRWGVDATILP